MSNNGSKLINSVQLRVNAALLADHNYIKSNPTSKTAPSTGCGVTMTATSDLYLLTSFHMSVQLVQRHV